MAYSPVVVLADAEGISSEKRELIASLDIPDTYIVDWDGNRRVERVTLELNRIIDLPPGYGPVGMRGIRVGGPRSRAVLRGVSPS